MPEMLEMQIHDGWLRLHRLEAHRRRPVYRLETGDNRSSTFDDMSLEDLREISAWTAAAIAEAEAEAARQAA